jgi:hypothetical protein
MWCVLFGGGGEDVLIPIWIFCGVKLPIGSKTVVNS